MTHLVVRMAGSIARNLFILLISILCCRCRHRVLRVLGLDKASSSNGSSSLEGIYVSSGSNNSSGGFGRWENWEPALPAPKNKALAAKAQQAKQQEEAEPEPDYFSDLSMAPKVTKPPLIVKKSREIARPDASKLALKEDHFPQLSSELTEWEDPSKNAAEGWQTVDVLSEGQQQQQQQHNQHYNYSSGRHPTRPKRPR